MTAPKLTSRDMVTALYRHFAGRWAILTEVTARPAAVGGRIPAGARDRRIDMLLVRGGMRVAIRPSPHRAPAHTGPQLPLALPEAGQPPDVPVRDDGGIERLAIEIKVSRGDFLQDVRDPSKQAPWRELAHRHAYAVPEGLVGVLEVPAGSGLIVVNPDNRAASVRFARTAPKTGHIPGPLPLANIMDAFYRASRAEAELKGYGFGVERDGDDPGRLRAELKRLRHDLDLAHNKAEQALERARESARKLAAVKPPPCSTCQQPLHPARSRQARRRNEDWEHRDEIHAALCEGMRKLAWEEHLDTLSGEDRRWARYDAVPGPQPADPGDGRAAA
ncbi:hypothetical protein [Phytohabitans houttuyneae]|uniref:Uncharacterized protein n=1 Tax=Phytohabitans houttuyneae TaxID=1076126 RepID=A0A6V8KC06_9ACTN|nr:hypothetical protein [Phytohabitans houttuyneae]GFJ79526.1 hypothetical protein Phou_037060 [Phytohabitans houttuyneae]